MSTRPSGFLLDDTRFQPLVVETRWVKAHEWPDLARSMTEEGWWLADLCGVDRLNLAPGGYDQADRPRTGAEDVNTDVNRSVDPEPSMDSENTPSPTDNGTGDRSDDSAASPSGRFEIVAHFLHRDRRERSRVHVLAQGDPPRVASITEIWPSADFMEREAFDLMGIVFDGHPNLKRIMLPDEWEGHPLRKDYGVGKIPIEFVPQPFLQFHAPHQQPNSQEGGVSVDRLGQPEVDLGLAGGGMSHFPDTKIDSNEDERGAPS